MTAPDPTLTHSRRWWTLAVLCLSLFVIVVDNTIVNVGPGASLHSWASAPNMTFANNAIYSAAATAVSFSGGPGSALVAGNVVYGPVFGASSGFQPGWGLGDFLSVTWTGTALLAVPTPWGSLPGAAVPWLAPPTDLIGNPRQGPIEPGCLEAW